METYEVLLFLHLLSVAFWLGSELFVEILVFRADRRGDGASVRKLFDELNALDPIFLPATLLVLATGIAMVIDGPWSFDTLWVALGLSGFALIYAYGFAYMEPLVKRAQAAIEREGTGGPGAQALMRRFFILWRIETGVVIAVVFVMVTKPTGSDVGVLALVAVALLATAAHSIWRARSVEASPVPAGQKP